MVINPQQNPYKFSSMQTTVNPFKLRRGIRYTFIDTTGSEFRANLDMYQSENGINKMAVRLTCVDGLQGALCMPISHIQSVKAYALPSTIPLFPHLIPEVSMIINQCI